MKSSKLAHRPKRNRHSDTAEAERSAAKSKREAEALRPGSRRGKILDLVEKIGFTRTALLSTELGVSEVSIRKDLQFLERRGLIERIHGGAQLTRHGIALLHLTERYTVNHTAKQGIALEAVRRLDRPGLQIYIDTGTTNALLAEAIPKDLPITIVTNSLGTIAALAGRPTCKVIAMGGVVNYEEQIFLGPWIESQLERFRFDFVFTGADSVTAEGFGSVDYTYSEMLHQVVTRCHQSFVLADSSKVGKRAANLYARPEEVTAWITDDGVPPALVSAFAAKGKQVIVTH